MNIGLEAWHLWIIVGICLFIGEVFIPGFLLASLGAGSLAAGAIHYLSGDFAYAIGGFIAAAGAALALIRPYLARALGPEQESRFGADGMIGDVLTVTDASDVGGQLKGRYRDTVWNLRCDDDLFEGDKAEIIAVDSGTLIVKPRRES
ncbi:MAG: NfeD family protein [Halieaceae bacterium]|jgi:membrane protein implicated in regulation of membrane protease activity|nr:NfeD family protein [Halieaceae bacterium]